MAGRGGSSSRGGDRLDPARVPAGCGDDRAREFEPGGLAVVRHVEDPGQPGVGEHEDRAGEIRREGRAARADRLRTAAATPESEASSRAVFTMFLPCAPLTHEVRTIVAS